MKRIILIVSLIFIGMSLSAQDMASVYMELYMNPDGTFTERLNILNTMEAEGLQRTAEFNHEALRFLLLRAPDMDWGNRNEKAAAEQAVIMLAQSIGNNKTTAAANDLWQAAEFFHVTREQPFTPNEGLAEQASIIALGDVDGRDFIPHIVQRLTDYNTQTYRNAETRRRVQTAVIGCIRALETFKDISGYRPIFFAFTGSWDPMVKQMAGAALPNITDDPADVIIEIIRDPSITPNIKLVAWEEMLKTGAPNSSKARVAANALEIGWFYQTSNRAFQVNLRTMRRGAIDIIRQFGVAGDNVYVDLEKSYSNNFISNQPDNDEVVAALNALSAIRTEEAFDLLHKFLTELHVRRRTGPWRNKERQFFDWVVASVGASGTTKTDTHNLLRIIRNDNNFTSMERTMAQNALERLGQ